MWFGDWLHDPNNSSKIVDENGEPKLVYHYTNNPELSEFSANFDNYFSKSKSKDIIVFIFDDLERTNLNYKLFLGYIDSILEELNYKIIILADESKITDKEYIEFKEKIIGKTFELQQENIHSIIKKFIEEYSNNTKNVLNENIEILIEDVDKNNDSINLRIIKQNIMAFENFFESLEDKFLENKEFTKQLIKNYFILSKELKTRTFNNQEENEKLRKEKYKELTALLGEYGINEYKRITGELLNELMKQDFEIKENFADGICLPTGISPLHGSRPATQCSDAFKAGVSLYFSSIVAVSVASR